MRSRARAREVAIVSCMDSSDFRERRFAASKSRSSPREDATVRGRGLRLEQRSEKGPFAVNHRRGETCGVRVEALGARTDSDRPCKGSCGARKRPRGVARGAGLGRAAGGRRWGNVRSLSTSGAGRSARAFRLEGEHALTAIAVSWALMGVGGFGPKTCRRT